MRPALAVPPASAATAVLLNYIMSVAIVVLGLLLALVGHAALWVGFVNRVHATGAPRWLVKLLSALAELVLVALPLGMLWSWGSSGASWLQWLLPFSQPGLWWIYLAPCWVAGVAALACWVGRHWLTRPPSMAQTISASIVDVPARLGRYPVAGLKGRALSFVPGNQVCKPEVRELQMSIERLPAALDGFSITVLSDLHFTGRIELDYFRAVVDEANALRSDIVAVCGDIADHDRYFCWIPQTLGRLSAPHGAYFILGNHDLFTGEVPRLRRTLAESGLIDLGGRWMRLNVDGVEIILAGNELPWFTPAADMEHCPPRTANQPQLRLLLSHTPDQFPWARRWDFDLMLAGHTHGGQICLPLVGPIFCPSRNGVKYAGGTFYAAPTVMHVSRGSSAELPLRLNCPPEVIKILLRSPNA